MFKKFKNEKGQSMVEFAIVLPILLLLICGIMDFGWLYYNQLALMNSVREGARYAVVISTDMDCENKVKTRINTVAPASLKPMQITVTWSKPAAKDEGDVTVVGTSNVHVLTPILGVFSSNQQKTLQAKVVMRVES